MQIIDIGIHGMALMCSIMAFLMLRCCSNLACWVRNAGIVSFSARLVAGMRAIETQEEEPLFTDPLAEVLAGQRGFSAARATLRVR